MSDFFPTRRDWTHPVLGHYADASLFFPQTDLDTVAIRCRGRLVYLASPFTKLVVGADGHYDFGRGLVAATYAARWSRRLAAVGVTAVSPIIQAVEMVHGDSPPILDPLDQKFWTCWCAPLLQACRAVVVPPIPGWAESDGVWRELRAALTAGRSVFQVDSGALVSGGVA